MNSIQKLRQMFNQEINTLSSNIDIRKRTPTDLIIFVQFDDGHIHTVTPDDEIFVKKAYMALANLIEERKE